MAILDSAGIETLPKGWLEVDARWLAGLWGLQATGEVKCVLTKILVGVRHPGIGPGQVVVGNLAHAIVPTGFAVKTEKDS